MAAIAATLSRCPRSRRFTAAVGPFASATNTIALHLPANAIFTAGRAAITAVLTGDILTAIIAALAPTVMPTITALVTRLVTVATITSSRHPVRNARRGPDRLCPRHAHYGHPEVLADRDG